MPENPSTGTSTLEKQKVLQAIDRLQAKLKEKGDSSHSQKLSILCSTLKSPSFCQLLTLQQSVRQLKEQLNRMPPDRCADFDFSQKGLLVFSADRRISIASGSAQQNSKPNGSHGQTLDTKPPSLPNFVSPHLSDDFDKTIQAMAQGRYIEHVHMQRPAFGSLGFSVTGLKCENGGELGIFIKEIHPGSIAERDGRLKEKDQILAINRTALDPKISHQQAIALLLQSVGSVDLIVARSPFSNISNSSVDVPTAAAPPIRWGHIEDIELVNDGSGLGFGIVGGKSTGVVVRTIVNGGLADRDGRLKTGDHILQIGGTDVQGMTSEQVAQVLRQCGNRVKLLIARDPIGRIPVKPPAPVGSPVCAVPPLVPARTPAAADLSDFEIYDVELEKDGESLGIAVVGHVGTSNIDSSGIFVKSIIPGSAAEHSGLIKVRDRIIAVDGKNVLHLPNQDVVETLRKTGKTVRLTLARKAVQYTPFPTEKSLDKVKTESKRLSYVESLKIRTKLDSDSDEVKDQVDHIQKETKVEPEFTGFTIKMYSFNITFGGLYHTGNVDFMVI
ncbi:inaD-like protein [Protopterus annectens]|uniref:inaD-like protein n=1 Tax=Protopterus annectens TaxID=7888 RepID=UPI001CFB56A9|nr:inaD-like protein [Protopterus annectens]